MTNLGKRPIAIVDDDERVLESLEELLEAAGHSVLLFTSGQALLDNGCLANIGCLISDIGMPVIDGFELQRLARAERPELPVILITAGQVTADQQRAIAQGSHGFFQKPFDGAALLGAVNRALLV